VKTLADQTAKATEDIKQQIAVIQGSTNGAVEAMQSIVVTMGDVNKNTQEITGAVQQQSATCEISHGVRQAARGTEDVVAHMMRGVTQGRGRNQPIGDADAPGRAARHTVENFLRQVGRGRRVEARKLSIFRFQVPRRWPGSSRPCAF